MASTGSSTFSIGQAREIVGDLFRHNPAIYWADFLISLTVGYAAAGVYLEPALPLVARLLCFPVAGFALYRVASIMHEIVHFRQNEFRGFKITWNILAGIPMLMPTYFYESHIAHHNTHYYGTGKDGEYLPLGNGTWGNILLFLCQVFLQPILVVFRFLFLTPISLLHPKLRRWVLSRASSFVINFRYARDMENDPPHPGWIWMDVACFIRAAMIFVAVLVGLTHWSRIPLLYSIAVFILGLNYVRTLAAHFYLGAGEKMSHEQQFFDSTVISGGWLTELLCPVGLRYHALHHLFPAVPYHNLGAAHSRLMEKLPEDSEYRKIVYPTFWSVMRDLGGNLRAASSQKVVSWYASAEDAPSSEPAESTSPKPPHDVSSKGTRVAQQGIQKS